MNRFAEYDPQLEALISLLDEPDSGSFSKIRDQIFAYGTIAVPMLETAWEHSFDNSLQQRIEDIIHNIQFDQLFLDLTQWAHYGNGNLLEGYILFTRYQYQGIDIELIRKQVHAFRRDIWLELNNNLTALEKVKVLNHIIFDLHKIQLPGRQSTEKRYLFLNNLLDTHIGYSIAVGLLYTLLAQSLDLPVKGILLPGERFVMGWFDQAGTKTGEPLRAMFYINPENGGGVFTRNEIMALLRKLKVTSDETFFRPVSPAGIIDKMFELLSYLSSSSNDRKKQNEIEHLRSALR